MHTVVDVAAVEGCAPFAPLRICSCHWLAKIIPACNLKPVRIEALPLLPYEMRVRQCILGDLGPHTMSIIQLAQKELDSYRVKERGGLATLTYLIQFAAIQILSLCTTTKGLYLS